MKTNFKIGALLFLLISVFLLHPVYAQNVRSDFVIGDLNKISETFRKNIIQFENQYKGRTFYGEFTLTGINQISSGKYRVRLRVGGILPLVGMSGIVDCFLSDYNSVYQVSNWGVGNAWTGRLVTTRGQIHSVSDDALVLYNQTIRAVGGYPDEIARRKDIQCD